MNDTTTKPLEILKEYRDACLREQTERETWKRCYEYESNWVDGKLGQWSRSNREKLGDRPDISFNEIRKFVNRLCGAQVQTKLDEKCYPRDAESDPVVAEILTDLMKYVKDINQAELEISKMFKDGIICSRGFIKTEFNDELDPLGEIRIKAINPFRVYPIGTGERYDWSDRRGIIEEIPMDMDEIKARFPDSEAELDGVKSDYSSGDIPIAEDLDYGFGSSIDQNYVYEKDSGKYLVLRRQKIYYESVKFLRNEATGKDEDYPKDEQGNEIDEKMVKLSIELSGQKIKIVTKKQKYISICYSLGSILLEEEKSKYKHRQFDITGFFCYVSNGRITGVVQDLLDPQDEKNKRHSQVIHILGTAAKNSYFVKKGAMDDVEKAKKEMGKTGSLIEINGHPKDVTSPIESNMTAVPAIINMEQLASVEMKEISGLNDASLGIVPEGVKSGRGISQLQIPVETLIAPIFYNYTQTRLIIFRKVLSLIQQYYNQPTRVRILGDYSKKLISPMIQQQIEAGLISLEDGSKVIAINQQMGEMKLNDVTVGRFDVVLDQIQQNPTMRRAEFFDKLNMKSTGAPIKWSTILRSYDGRGQAEMLMDAIEAETFMQMAMAGAPPQISAGKTGSPPMPDDLQNNIAGAQNPI